ncbi:MAG: hypothetical protein JJE09_06720 [Bacteroidia bacterium]|nr:hypothetical protein [Bacteroidia bacterium]
METPHFLDSWDQYMYYATAACIGIGVIILLYHEYNVLKKKDYKEKYDYVNEHEIRYFWYSMMVFVVAGAFYANSLGTDLIMTKGMIWFYVRLFITVSFLTIAYFIVFSMVQIYYPKYLEKRLVKLRHKPRISPEGNAMRRLLEHEEDAHLDESQIAEEASVHSVDYDVWLDDATGFKKVEKYDAYLHAIECTNCGYFTMKVYLEEISKKPTATENGSLIKHFKCNYCKHREVQEAVISKLSENI